jgi:hypothetical protein
MRGDGETVGGTYQSPVIPSRSMGLLSERGLSVLTSDVSLLQFERDGFTFAG